jgi:hypothetical protein
MRGKIKMISDSSILALIQFMPYAGFKDAKTGKYILVSDGLAARANLGSSTQMVGLTVDDLGFLQTMHWGKAVTKQVKESHSSAHQCLRVESQLKRRIHNWIVGNRNIT